jgi:hypothetical protein
MEAYQLQIEIFMKGKGNFTQRRRKGQFWRSNQKKGIFNHQMILLSHLLPFARNPHSSVIKVSSSIKMTNVI